jgi:hypothetical protein
MERSGRAERRQSSLQQLGGFEEEATESADDSDAMSSADFDADDFLASPLASAPSLADSDFGMHDDCAMGNLPPMDPSLHFSDTLFNTSNILPSHLPSMSGQPLAQMTNRTPSSTPFSGHNLVPGPHISHGDGFLMGDLDMGMGMDIVGQQTQLTSSSLPAPATSVTAGHCSDSGSDQKYKLILEDLKPDTLHSIVDMLLRSKSTVKMEMMSE